MKHAQIAAIILTLAVLSGCVGLQPDEVLLPRTDISLTVKGDVQMAFDAGRCQIGYNNARNEFRMVNDKLSDWVIFRSDEVPAEAGQTVTAYLEYTVDDNTKRMNGLEFSVEKINPQGMVWLWNKDKKIGIVIKIIQ